LLRALHQQAGRPRCLALGDAALPLRQRRIACRIRRGRARRTGLNSDLPGMVLAQVTENVRDSATGRTVLIPQGARLLGRYESGVTYGQRRAMLVWQRIVFPDGSSVALADMPATDRAG
jgi:hypothetical protein